MLRFIVLALLLFLANTKVHSRNNLVKRRVQHAINRVKHTSTRVQHASHRTSQKFGDGDCAGKTDATDCIVDKFGALGECLTFKCVASDKKKEVCAKTPLANAAAIVKQNIEDLLKEICKSDTPRYHGGNENRKNLVRGFISNKFVEYGLEVKQLWFPIQDFGGTDVSGSHIYGFREGKSNPKKVWIVGAHYDTQHYYNNVGPNTPGVIDNGSGVAVLLEMARVISAGVKLDDSIAFFAFDFEEEKCCPPGGTNWLTKSNGANLPWPKADIRGMFSLDSVGATFDKKDTQDVSVLEGAHGLFDVLLDWIKTHDAKAKRGDFILSVTNTKSSALEVAASGAAKCAGADFPYNKFEFPTGLGVSDAQICSTCKTNIRLKDLCESFCRSDHGNFWNLDIPAIQLTDTGEYRHDATEWYHEPEDDLSRVGPDNFEFMTRVARLTTAAITHLAGY